MCDPFSAIDAQIRALESQRISLLTAQDALKNELDATLRCIQDVLLEITSWPADKVAAARGLIAQVQMNRDVIASLLAANNMGHAWSWYDDALLGAWLDDVGYLLSAESAITAGDADFLRVMEARLTHSYD